MLIDDTFLLIISAAGDFFPPVEPDGGGDGQTVGADVDFFIAFGTASAIRGGEMGAAEFGITGDFQSGGTEKHLKGQQECNYIFHGKLFDCDI